MAGTARVCRNLIEALRGRCRDDRTDVAWVGLRGRLLFLWKEVQP
jgi:hypothetical protein